MGDTPLTEMEIQTSHPPPCEGVRPTPGRGGGLEKGQILSGAFGTCCDSSDPSFDGTPPPRGGYPRSLCSN